MNNACFHTSNALLSFVTMLARVLRGRVGVKKAALNAYSEGLHPARFFREFPRGLDCIDAFTSRNGFNRQPPVFDVRKLDQLFVFLKIEVLVDQSDSKAVYGIVFKEYFAKLDEYF
jgi:hypothetical protein